MPVREIAKKYTKSELAIVAWRSAETAHNLEVATKVRRPHSDSSTGPETPGNRIPEDTLEVKMGPEVVAKLGGEDGEVDLRKMTGAEAMRFMSALSIGMGRNAMEDDVSRAYKGFGSGRPN